MITEGALRAMCDACDVMAEIMLAGYDLWWKKLTVTSFPLV
jgi:hypothetical protein